MQRTLKYVGLDVHQATTVAAVRDGRGRLLARMVLPTEEAALLADDRSSADNTVAHRLQATL